MKVCKKTPIPTLCVLSYLKSVERPAEQVAIEGGGRGSPVLLDGPQLLVELLVAGGEAAHDDITVTSKVLGHRMHH